MLCTHCGNEVDSGVRFCPHCGATVFVAEGSQQPQPQPQYSYSPLTEEQGMKWYKFLINFSLFAGAVLNLITAVGLLTGSVYDGSAELVYSVFDGLKSLDMVIGIGLVALSVLGFYTRSRLAGYHRNGPTMLNALYLAVAGIELAYVIGVSAILSEGAAVEIDFSSSISSVIVSAVMVVVNTTYFKKRAHLFVND